MMVAKYFNFWINCLVCLFLLTSCGSSSGGASNGLNVSESVNNTILRSENNELILNLPSRFEDALTDYLASIGYESIYKDEQTDHFVGLFNQEMSNRFSIHSEYTESL